MGCKVQATGTNAPIPSAPYSKHWHGQAHLHSLMCYRKSIARCVSQTLHRLLLNQGCCELTQKVQCADGTVAVQSISLPGSTFCPRVPRAQSTADIWAGLKDPALAETRPTRVAKIFGSSLVPVLATDQSRLAISWGPNEDPFFSRLLLRELTRELSGLLPFCASS